LLCLLLDPGHVQADSDQYQEGRIVLDFVVLLPVEARFEEKVQRNEKLQQGYKKPRRDDIRWPEQQEGVHHV
jgi:hypothetical protein